MLDILRALFSQKVKIQFLQNWAASKGKSKHLDKMIDTMEFFHFMVNEEGLFGLSNDSNIY